MDPNGFAPGLYALLTFFGIYFAVALFVFWWIYGEKPLGYYFYAYNYLIFGAIVTSASADQYDNVALSGIIISLVFTIVGILGFTSLAGVEGPARPCRVLVVHFAQDRFEGGAGSLGRASRLQE